MRKFILIDQSIKDARGHHLEYALRVLKAAKSLGFQSVLGTNKDCGDIINEHIDVVDKAFSHTFWENYQSEFVPFAPNKHKLFNKIIKRKRQIVYDLMYSHIGFSYMVANQGLSLSDIFIRYGSRNARNKLSVLTILAGYALARFCAFHTRIVKKHDLFARTVRWVNNSVLITFAGAIGLIAISPILLPYMLLRWSRINLRSDIYSSKFANDMQGLLVRVNAVSDDIIFIPTLGNVELIGSGICSERLPIENIAWHFLFRRNIFQGREPTYQKQIVDQYRILKAFSTCRHLDASGNFKFYTDTDALTEQYNRLGSFKFSTLPIPLDESIERAKINNRKILNINYIGDARDEKGFPILSRLVADMRAAGYTEDDVKFTFQSNFNVINGEPGSRVAKVELAVESPRHVILAEGPFASEQYSAIINNADILIVPYDPNSYYARSSGVFTEALVAGIPVVASDKSWMSQELLEYNQEYYQYIAEKYKLLQQKKIENPSSRSKIIIKPLTNNDWVYLLVNIAQPYPNPGCYANISWRTSPVIIAKQNRDNPIFNEVSADLRLKNSMVLVRIPRIDKILLEFCVEEDVGIKVSTSKSSIKILEIVISEFDVDQMKALYFGSALYSEDADFAAAVSEVINNYDQYENDSQVIMKKWRSFHSSENLVQVLSRGIN